MLTVDEKVLLWVLPLAGLGKGGTSNKGGEGGGLKNYIIFLKKVILYVGKVVQSRHSMQN